MGAMPEHSIQVLVLPKTDTVSILIQFQYNYCICLHMFLLADFAAAIHWLLGYYTYAALRLNCLHIIEP